MEGTKLLRGGACAALILLSASVPAAYALDNADSLADLSLQELANLPVTSVSKKAEPLSQAAASVYVISNDDIRRSGARTLPEALRLAPNLQVGQATADSWAISARGSNETYADKLLVLLDGRIIYSPIFSGTYWEVQNVVLEDVDRIEVISGPGGTLWGTNAVNGVINIITKKSQDTQGSLASAGGGRLGADAELRYGSGGDDSAYRVYGMYKDTYSSDTANGVPQHDGVRLGQAGFRSDWNRTDHAFTLQGDVYSANEEQALPGQAQAIGFNLLGRWDQQLSGGSDLDLLAYWDHAQRSQPLQYDDTLDITDIELQQTLPAFGEHSLTWGASYRYAWDAWRNYPGWALTFYPASAREAWSSVFGQDQIQLTQAWRLIAGARLERGPYTGYEFLPNLRVAWQPAANLLTWLAASRAVRDPARLDTNWYAPASPPYFLQPSGAFTSETVNVYELGFRSDLGDWSFSAAVYHNDYLHLRTTTLVSLAPVQVTLGNGMTLRENGFESWATYKPMDNWRLQLGFSALHQDFTLAPTAVASSISSEGNDAPEWWSLRSSYDFADGLELDATVRHSGALPDALKPTIPAYTTGDLRLGWRWTPKLELSVLAQNLFGPPHTEYNPQGPVTQFGRGLYARLTWQP